MKHGIVAARKGKSKDEVDLYKEQILSTPVKCWFKVAEASNWLEGYLTACRKRVGLNNGYTNMFWSIIEFNHKDELTLAGVAHAKREIAHFCTLQDPFKLRTMTSFEIMKAVKAGAVVRQNGETDYSAGYASSWNPKDYMICYNISSCKSPEEMVWEKTEVKIVR